MFEDVSIGSVRFKSKQVRNAAEVETMTLPIELNENETQTILEVEEMGTQTAPRVFPKGKKEFEETEEQSHQTLSFLQKVGPLMLKEMNKNIHTRAFDGYEEQLEQFEDGNIQKMFTLSFDYDTYFQSSAPPPQPMEKTSKQGNGSSSGPAIASLKLSCSGISWNCNGSVLAVSYGRFDHTGWCNYRSALCIWNIFQHDFNPQKPHMVLETSSALMCVAHHPKNPSIVAAGTFNGEVCAWNLESEDYKFCSSSIGDYYHREPVTKLTWVFDLQADDYNLCSISGDGKILFWRLKDRLAYPTEGYVMMQTQGSKVHNSSTNSSSSSSSSSTNSQIIGGKSLAFCMMDKINRSFIVGSEGGIIARCFCKNGPIKASDFKNSETKWTATAAKIIAKIPNTKYQQIAKRQVETYAKEKKLKEITLASVFESKIDPTNLYPSAMDQYFESHGGPVYDLTFSPFCKKIFLTCSSDGTARLYDHTEKEPLLNLEVTSSYLYAAAWSKTRPLVFALSAEDGCVYLYDLKVNRYSPVAILKSKDEIVESKTSGTNSTSCGTSKSSTKSTCMGRENALFTLEFNPRQRNFLAAGDAMGCVHIWKLNWRLANLQTNEISTLENFKKMTTTYY